MDIRKIKKLIELVEKSNISKLEISEGKQTIRIVQLSPQVSSVVSTNSIHNKSQNLPYIANIEHHDNNNDHQKLSSTSTEYIVRSPIVGIFYRAAHPDEKPFISIGQSVNIGSTLCIIEAMKVMNHIQSDKQGIIKSILVKNEQPVEFDEPLLIITIKKEHNVK